MLDINTITILKKDFYLPIVVIITAIIILIISVLVARGLVKDDGDIFISPVNILAGIIGSALLSAVLFEVLYLFSPDPIDTSDNVEETQIVSFEQNDNTCEIVTFDGSELSIRNQDLKIIPTTGTTTKLVKYKSYSWLCGVEIVAYQIEIPIMDKNTEEN